MYPVHYESYQWEQLTGNIEFAQLQVKSILESEPILGFPRGLQYPYYRGANQPDVCYCINLQVDMEQILGCIMGFSRHSIFIQTNYDMNLQGISCG